MSKKQEILKLRDEGKSYREIEVLLGCSRSVISYYCNSEQAKKSSERQKRNRKKNVLVRRIESFRYKFKDFQRKRDNSKYIKNGRDVNFSLDNVLEKIGDNPKCYLTGRLIDLKETKTYQFDHMTPVSKGGSCEIDNFGLTCSEANRAKNNLTIEEFVLLCKDVLVNHGFTVEKKDLTTE